MWGDARCPLVAIHRRRVALTRAQLLGGGIIEAQGKKDWVNIAFLTLTPIIGVVGTAAWTLTHGLHLWMPILMLTLYLLVGISICAGYHRFFSHKSYEASPIVQ